MGEWECLHWHSIPIDYKFNANDTEMTFYNAPEVKINYNNSRCKITIAGQHYEFKDWQMDLK